MRAVMMTCYKPRYVGPYGPEASRTTPQMLKHIPHASHTAAPLSLQNKTSSLSYSAANMWMRGHARSRPRHTSGDGDAELASAQRAKGKGQVWETHSQTIRSDNWRDFRKKCLFQCGGPAGISALLNSYARRRSASAPATTPKP